MSIAQHSLEADRPDQPSASASEVTPEEYKRRIWAWTMYDWANSAYVTTVLAAVLPIYFSQVAGSTLPSAAVATSYWSIGLSISLLIVAAISPVLGTISDIQRGKKRFLAIFAGIGVLGSALLVLVSYGDWILASILVLIGRIGFNGANTFYDALLPHVARPEDQDAVSTRGYAMGYLGGGLLLAINVVMLQVFPGTWGARLSFLSVAIWWAVFTLPLLRRVPEPPAATVKLAPGETVVSAGFKRMRATLGHIRRYRELFKYLIAFLIYNDGIGTIIGVAAIYGAELGFGSTELVLALLMVQFVGIPYSLIFGRLPNTAEKRRPFFLAFIVFNIIALPLAGLLGRALLPVEISGAKPAPYVSTANAVGQGTYTADAPAFAYTGNWETTIVPASTWVVILGGDRDKPMAAAADPGAAYEVRFNGQTVKLTYSTGPDRGIWAVLLDGQPLLDPETNQPVRIDAYNPTERFDVTQTFSAAAPGEHALRVENTGQSDPASQGTRLTVLSVEVLPPARGGQLSLVIGMVVAVEAACLLLAWLLGRALFSGLVQKLTTKRSVLLALFVYAIIAIWGYFLDSVVEFWFLAWLVAIVQGGSQALSRSLYAAMSPAAMSGEFFGLFGIMEKFSALVGPLVFAAAGLYFGSSRPAVLSLIAFFIIGGLLLAQVNVDEGKRVAKEEDARALAQEG